jgi:DNA gyrase subunit A
MGRATQGVRLINLRDDDSIAAVAKVELDDSAVEDVFLEDESDDQKDNISTE